MGKETQFIPDSDRDALESFERKKHRHGFCELCGKPLDEYDEEDGLCPQCWKVKLEEAI